MGSWMREYAVLYQQLVEQVVYRLHNLLLLRKACPRVYDIVRLHLNPVKQVRPLPPKPALSTALLLCASAVLVPACFCLSLVGGQSRSLGLLR